MTVFETEFDHKDHRASCRVASLSKSRAQFKRQSSEKHGRKVSAVPSGSDFATPHRAARVATRSRLARGNISLGSDMPQISMGRAGYWIRWVRKPSIARLEKLGIEPLDIDEGLEAYDKEDHELEEGFNIFFSEVACDASGPFDLNVDDRHLFPELKDTFNAKIPSGARAVKEDKDLAPQEETLDVMEQGLIECDSNLEHSEKDDNKGAPEDWVVLSSSDALTVVDAVSEKQARGHPENNESSFDWSVTGMPKELLRRIIRGSTNAAHHSMHSEKKLAPVPLDILRVQTSGSAKRQRSTSKTPRSQSKPRVTRQQSRGR